VSILDRHDIQLLVDVRSHPGSNKHPQFNREEMQAALGARYSWLPSLGGPTQGVYANPKFPKHHIGSVRPEFKGIPDEARPKVWWNRGLFDYAVWMGESAEFSQGLEDLTRLCHLRVAIMCAEALWWKCHRSMIADAWEARGGEVWHLFQKGKPRRHILSGRLERYPLETQRLWSRPQPW
jgi:uncharacterized protein (DUF488 family)